MREGRQAETQNMMASRDILLWFFLLPTMTFFSQLHFLKNPFKYLALCNSIASPYCVYVGGPFSVPKRAATSILAS